MSNILLKPLKTQPLNQSNFTPKGFVRDSKCCNKKFPCLIIVFLIGLSVLTPQKSDAQAIGDYLSAADGVWSSAGTWQRWNGSIWAPATVAPSSVDGVITVRSDDTVNVTSAITIDQTIVSGMVQILSGSINVVDGPGTDLQLDWTNAMPWASGPPMTVSLGALVYGPNTNIFYRGTTLTNNGTIRVNIFSMRLDPGAQVINGVGEY